jgi:transcriptional regulator with XRE-family HTH domain
MSASRPETKTQQFGPWLKSQIQARGMTQGEFAQAVGVSATSVSRWIAGDQPKGIHIDAIADVLVLDYDVVATRAGYRPRELLQIDPDSPEAQLLPYIRAVDWSKHEAELAMIKRQLEFIVEVDRGEHDRTKRS